MWAVLAVRPVRSWLAPLTASEQSPAGVGAVFLTYQAPECPARLRVAVVSSTLEAVSQATPALVAGLVMPSLRDWTETVSLAPRLLTPQEWLVEDRSLSTRTPL